MISPSVAQWVKIIGLVLSAFTTSMAVAVDKESAEGAAVTVLETLNIAVATYGALQAGLLTKPNDARAVDALTRRTDTRPSKIA